MFISFYPVFSSAFDRLINPAEVRAGGTLLGIGLYVISLCATTRQWLKSRPVACTESSPIMESPWRVFRI